MKLAIPTVLAAATAAAFTLSAGQRGPVAAVIATPIDLGGPPCSLVCTDDLCPQGQHDAWEPCYLEPTHDGIRHSAGCGDPDCLAGACSEHHPECDGGQNLASSDIESLRVALQDEDVEGVRTLLAAHDTRLIVNTERSAIQVLSCTGKYIAHLPVNDGFIGRLTEQAGSAAAAAP